MAFVKHIGKHGDRKVAIIYREVPGEEHMCLVVYPDTLPKAFHDATMKVIESAPGQQASDLSEPLFRNLLPDGRPILQTLHKEGMIKKVPTSQVVVTPNATSHVRLDELNTILNGMEAGDEATQKMAELDKNSGMVNPLERDMNDIPPPEPHIADDVLDDSALAQTNMLQAEKMAAEANALLAESKRLQEEAWKLDPSLKPKRTTRKKAATKKKTTAKKKVAKKAPTKKAEPVAEKTTSDATE